MELFQIARDVITSVVAMVGGTVAVLGYSAWHRQILGKTEHDVARSVLLCALKVREAIRSVRAQGALLPAPTEFGSQEQVAFDSDESRRSHLRQIMTERLDRLQDRVTELELATLEGEALWGAKAKASIATLTQLARDLNAAVWGYLVAHRLLGWFRSAMHDPVGVRRSWEIIHRPSSRDGDDGSDAFGQHVDDAIHELERYYRPKLRLERR